MTQPRFGEVSRGDGRIDTVAPELDRRFCIWKSRVSERHLVILGRVSERHVSNRQFARSLGSRAMRFALHGLLLGRADGAVDAGFRCVADGAG